MLKTVRLSYFGNEKNWGEIKSKVIGLLKNKYNCEQGGYNDGYSGWHLGNYCFCEVKEDMAKEIIVEFPELKIDGYYNFLEKSDLNNFKVGDNVMVSGLLGGQKGKVYSITDNQITIRKFHSQTKGWIFNTGMRFDVEKI